MPISAGELAQIVWAETSDLGVADSDGSGDVNKVRRLVAQLAASTGGVGFDKRKSLPLANDSIYGGTATAIMKIADDAKDLGAPESHLIIWDAGPDSSKLNLATKTRLPEPWASINPNTITNQLHRTLPSGRTIDVFSRAAPVGATGTAPLVNALSGTGLRTGRVEATNDSGKTNPNPRPRMAWFLGIAGVLFFIAGGAMSALSGLSAAGARNSLVTADPGRQSALVLQTADVCRKESQTLPPRPAGPGSKAICQDLDAVKTAIDVLKMPQDKIDQIFDAARGCHSTDKDKNVSSDCNTLWRAAVAADQDQAWKRSYFAWTYAASAYLTSIKADAGSSSIALPFLITVIGVAGLIIALGLGTKGRVAGVWIDARNRVSLARAQVTLWTAVALSGYLILAMFNVGFAEILPAPQNIADYSAFPTIPTSIIAALGIATGSTMLSPLILGTKDSRSGPILEEQDLKRRGAPFFGNATSGLSKNDSAKLASITDVFMGEEQGNADTVDVSRLQNVMITITLVLSFFYFLLEEMSNIKINAMLGANNAVFDSLPPLGATFASLLAVSHASYLVAKAYDKGNEPQRSHATT
jgi:hypothetical protein